MPWICLLLAGILEIVWAIAMKYSAGFTKLAPTIVTFAGGFGSFYLLAIAVDKIPIGTAYAVWTGIGAAGTAILGMMLFNEPRNALRLACIVLIVAGIAGLKVFSSK